MDNIFPRKHSKPPWASHCREVADGAGMLQPSASYVFAPVRNSLDVADHGEKDVVAMLVGLEVGVSGRPAAGTCTAVQGQCLGCTLQSLGSSGCKMQLTPSQRGDAIPLGVQHGERSPMVPIFRLGWLHVWSQLWISNLSACAFAICLRACDSLVRAPR